MCEQRTHRRSKTVKGEGEIRVDRRGVSPRGDRKDDRKERREKRRAFFIKFSSNIKWIMLAAAVIAVILFAKFGLPF